MQRSSFLDCASPKPVMVACLSHSSIFVVHESATVFEGLTQSVQASAKNRDSAFQKSLPLSWTQRGQDTMNN